MCNALQGLWGRTHEKVFLSGINSSKRAHMSKSQMKTMLITFFNIKGIHFEFIPQGPIVNQAYYVEMKQLCEAVHRKRPELWPNVWLLHHDNSPAHCQAVSGPKVHYYNGTPILFS
jgi:hypothetical protein